MLNTFYVWHGCGAIVTERQAATKYAQKLCEKSLSGSVTELVENENDDDEMFWMILGDEGFGRADHWRWRRDASGIEPRIWRVNARLGERAVCILWRLVVVVPHLTFSSRLLRSTQCGQSRPPTERFMSSIASGNYLYWLGLSVGEREMISDLR